jgi:hypothetical protein
MFPLDIANFCRMRTQPTSMARCGNLQPMQKMAFTHGEKQPTCARIGCMLYLDVGWNRKLLWAIDANLEIYAAEGKHETTLLVGEHYVVWRWETESKETWPLAIDLPSSCGFREFSDCCPAHCRILSTKDAIILGYMNMDAGWFFNHPLNNAVGSIHNVMQNFHRWRHYFACSYSVLHVMDVSAMHV